MGKPLLKGRNRFGDRCCATSAPNLIVCSPFDMDALSCSWYTLMIRPSGNPASTPKLTRSSGLLPDNAMLVGHAVGAPLLQLGKDDPSKNDEAREKLNRT